MLGKEDSEGEEREREVRVEAKRVVRVLRRGWVRPVTMDRIRT